MLLLQNALAAAPLGEEEGLDGSNQELNVLTVLIEALFRADDIDELEPLVARYREAGKVYLRTSV